MTDVKWKRSEIIESGNYPKNSFSDVLSKIYVAQNEKLNGALELKLEFESGKQVSTLMFNQAGTRGVFENPDDPNKVIVDGKKISQFIASIEKLDAKTGQINMNNNGPSVTRIQTEWAFLDGVPTGFRTIPDMVGCTLSMVATLERVGDEQQTSGYPEWTVGAVQGLQEHKPVPKVRAPAAPKPTSPPKNVDQSTISDELILDSLLDSPKSLSGLFNGFNKKYDPASLRAKIAQLKDEGKITQVGEKYEAV